jgi:uncharacterized protein
VCSIASLTSTVASSPDTPATHTAHAQRRALLLSIHDVTPALEGRVRALWELCRARGVVPALLVVPNWHGEAPLERAPAFVRWIRTCADLGCELFLHGERHDEHGVRRGWRDAWRAWGRTAREGEFLSLDEAAARERIERGLACLRRLELEPIGFVPPAWLARPGCWRAVDGSGLRLSEDARAVHIHGAARRTRVASPVIRWSARTTMRAHGSSVVAAARWSMQRRAPVVRIALHPGDLAHPRTTRSVAVALDRWLGDRPATAYRSLITDDDA